jgi:preprotein translocase subunit YajC
VASGGPGEALHLSLLLLQNGSAGNPILGFLPMILIFGIFYFLLFLPMQRQKKAQQQMLAGLKNGDMVQTSGGIIGAVHSINADDDTLVLRVKPDNVKMLVARSAVSALLNPEGNK